MKKLLALALLLCLASPALAQQPVVTSPATQQAGGAANVSSTISVTDTFQSLWAATPLRLGCVVQNNGTNSMWVFFGPLASATKGTSVLLAAGQVVNCQAGVGTANDQVSVTGTSGDAFFATQGAVGIGSIAGSGGGGGGAVTCALCSTAANQTSGAQKTQVVDSGGNVIGATANALDINIKSGNPTTIAVTQATASNLNAQVVGSVANDAVGTGANPLLTGGYASAAAPSDVSADGDAVRTWHLRSGALVDQLSFGGVLATTGNGVSGTGVQRVTIASDSTGQVALAASAAVIGHVIADTGSTTAVTQATGTNLHAVLDATSTTAVTQATGTNLHVVTDSGTITTVSTVTAVTGITNGFGVGANGPQKLEDVASAGGNAGVASMCVRLDTPVAGANVSNDADFTNCLVDNMGKNWISGAYIEDVASADGDRGVSAFCVQKATPADTAGTDGDYEPIECSGGRLWTSTIGNVTPADALALGTTSLSVIARGATYNGSTSDLLRGAANALNSTGTGLATAQAIGQFDDVAPTSITENQFGNLRMSANRNLYGTIRDAAGNERGLNVDANGAIAATVTNATAANLKVEAVGTVTPADAAALGTTSIRTYAAGGNYNGSTIDLARGVVNSTNSVGTGIAAAGQLAQCDDTSPTAITENSFGNARMDCATHAQLVTTVPSATAGGTTLYTLTLAASTNATNVKASAGQLYSISGFNMSSATPIWVSLYNNSGTPTCGTSIIQQFMIPGNTTGAGFVYDFATPKGFATGIAFCATTGIAGTGNAAASTYVLNIDYK